MALRANSTELFFIFVANEEDAISDFYGILSVENKMTANAFEEDRKKAFIKQDVLKQKGVCHGYNGSK